MPDPCIPDSLPLEHLEWRLLLPLVGKANASLARYDGMLQALPNPSVLLSPITANEAVLSSKIEGTQATLDEVLEADAGLVISEARRGDIEEISNYRLAVRDAEVALADRRVSLSLIKAIHQRLLRGVRGRDKAPGAFREGQNWIGRAGVQQRGQSSDHLTPRASNSSISMAVGEKATLPCFQATPRCRPDRCQSRVNCIRCAN